MLHDHHFLALHPEWVLRNETNKVIIYLMSNYECSYMILDPVSATIVPFLNGRRNVKELAEIIHFTLSLPSIDKARSLLEQLVEKLNVKDERVAVLEKPALWSVDYNPLDFIISPDDFDDERRLTKPLSILIYFSGFCQTNCIYCYADLANMRRPDHLSLEQWTHILQEALKLDIRKVNLTGGDPLGRPDSIDFLCNLIENGFLFMASTKCYVSLSDAQRMVEVGFNESVNAVDRDFQVSIDSPDPVIADRMMRSEGYLDRATETVRNLIKAGIPAQVKAVLTTFNYHQVRDHVKTFAELGVKFFRFTCYSRTYYRHDDDLFLSDEMKAMAADLLKTVADELPEITIEGDAKKYIPTDQQNSQQRREDLWAVRSGCSGGRTNLGIAPDGRALLCEQMPLEDSYFVGDLKKQSILEVWNSQELLDFIFPEREGFAGTPCYSCADFDECIHNIGHCYRDSFFAYGNLLHPPPNCIHMPASTYRSI